MKKNKNDHYNLVSIKKNNLFPQCLKPTTKLRQVYLKKKKNKGI